MEDDVFNFYRIVDVEEDKLSPKMPMTTLRRVLEKNGKVVAKMTMNQEIDDSWRVYLVG